MLKSDTLLCCMLTHIEINQSVKNRKKDFSKNIFFLVVTLKMALDVSCILKT